ncbi:piggyBac transposable element-derived protein 4-like [Sitophilus oryzae]|uniref:PiggyBac transposable element-derived protein 4-like n=1 Tax=Sitophilus oryzae TaxID=7048 RepID=A0A6J2XQV9_SITOR|nr:piggyBac transposable element-derived protein 4-like [Sitophilus oryzae]
MDSLPGTSASVRYSDENYGKQLLNWYNEIDSDDSDRETELDPNEIEESVHDTESEQEDESEDIEHNKNESDNEEELDESEEDEISSNYFYGKDRYKWSKEPAVSKNTRTMKHNIVTKLPGIKGIFYAEKKNSALSIWNSLITNDMLDIIIRWTIVRLRRERLKYKNQNHSDLRDLDVTELKSFIGLLFFTSIFKSNTEDIRSIFATDGSGRDIFRCVTNANRFAILLICLRFDNPNDRSERKKNDPIAPISEVFNSFVANCQSLYTLGTGACIDEMLIAFRGRSKFKIYMPNKPAKYGLKLMVPTDARTSYFYNGYLYCGKDSDGLTLSDEDRRKFAKPSQSVLRLAKPIFGSNRNITADNWFSSVELVDMLKSKH